MELIFKNSSVLKLGARAIPFGRFFNQKFENWRFLPSHWNFWNVKSQLLWNLDHYRNHASMHVKTMTSLVGAFEKKKCPTFYKEIFLFFPH